MKKALVGLAVVSLFSFSAAAFSSNGNDLNTEKCVGSIWKDASGNTISVDDQFGEGSAAVTRCLANTKRVKVLYQINVECKSAACDGAYAIGNIKNHINDLEVTHGLTPKDYSIEVIIHSAGWKLVLDNNAAVKHAADNPFQAEVESLIAKPSVDVRFCQNTAHSKNVKLANMIPGIGFVTSGVSAIADFQKEGYSYVQP